MAIKNDMLKDAPSLNDIKKQVRNKIMSGVFIEQSFNWCDIKVASDFFAINQERLYIYSTASLSKKLFPDARTGHSLAALCKRFRVKWKKSINES